MEEIMMWWSYTMIVMGPFLWHNFLQVDQHQLLLTKLQKLVCKVVFWTSTQWLGDCRQSLFFLLPWHLPNVVHKKYKYMTAQWWWEIMQSRGYTSRDWYYPWLGPSQGSQHLVLAQNTNVCTTQKMCSECWYKTILDFKMLLEYGCLAENLPLVCQEIKSYTGVNCMLDACVPGCCCDWVSILPAVLNKHKKHNIIIIIYYVERKCHILVWVTRRTRENGKRRRNDKRSVGWLLLLALLRAAIVPFVRTGT